MCDPTCILRRWHHHDSPSTTLSLASHVLDDQISDMNQNSISALYCDFRSPSRSAHRNLRRQKRILNPMFRTKHCAYHRSCLLYSKPYLSSRRRRWQGVRTECTDDAYWDRECAELEHRERVECADLVTLYYNYGHNAEVIESLRPRPSEDVQSEGREGEGDADEWVSLSRTTDGDADAKTGVEAKSEVEPEVITTRDWTLYLHRASSAAIPTSSTNYPDAGCCAADETTFTFHRNATGVWELGYANPYSSTASDLYGCTQLPLPLDCGCCSFTSGFFACSCASFPSDWRSPEEDWQGSLMQWVSVEAAQRMRLADTLHNLQQLGFALSWRGLAQPRPGNEEAETRSQGGWGEWTFVRAPGAERAHGGKKRDGEDWDVVSQLSSTGSWRVVDVT